MTDGGRNVLLAERRAWQASLLWLLPSPREMMPQFCKLVKKRKGEREAGLPPALHHPQFFGWPPGLGG